MKCIATAGLSVAFLVTGAAALAATPAPGQMSNSAPPAAASTSSELHRQFDPKIDHVGDRYTDALNILEANGYTGVENFAPDGQDFTATALHAGNHRVAVIVDPSAGTVKSNG